MVELNINADYVPSPGTTITAAIIHRIVDEADVTATGQADNTGPFDVVSGYSLTYRGSIQSLQDTGLKVGHVTEMSLSAVLYDNQLSKGGVSYYYPASAPTMASTMYKGLPAFIYPNPGPGAGLLGHKARTTAKNSPGATPDSLDGDARYRHAFPIINGDLKRVEQSGVTISSYGITAQTRFCPFVLCNQTTTTATLQPIEVIFKGPAEALVHASLSSSFNKNDMYALRMSGSSPFMNYPVSWDGTGDNDYVPYGVIRDVYTSSGVTNIVHHRITDSYSLAAQPYYVARVFFWGEPCL